MEDKKEMIAELTNTAWSLIDEFNRELNDSTLPLHEAQKLAKERVAQIRYGPNQKDYFWIIDNTPIMVMHPYRPDLINQNLSDYQDAEGKKLFVEAANIVKENNDGFIDYLWQWKDDSLKIVPKLSYVKSYKPWGWIVGTGIYLDDVEQEIKELKNSLLVISVIIVLIIALIQLYVVRQSLLIEVNRQRLNEELQKSRQKYKTLVEASNEGTLMFLNNSVIFSNARFSSLCGYPQDEVRIKTIDQIFQTSWDEILPEFSDTKKTFTFESKLYCADHSLKDAILSVSKVEYANSYGFIISTKEVSGKHIAEKESEMFSGEIKTTLLLMQQPIRKHIQTATSCPAEYPIQKAANLMERSKLDFLLIKQDKTVLGIVTQKDISGRAVAKNLDLNAAIATIMSAPLCTISETARLHEALFLLTSKKVSHLVTTDADNAISGVISVKSVLAVQHNTLSFILHKIENSYTVEELTQAHNTMPTLVYALANSNEHVSDTVAFASLVSDKITTKLIEFATEKFGPAPCKYSFIAMGSEGRKEQTLVTDQDNAIIFEDGPNNTKNQEYFLEMANYVCDSLNDIGYNYCKGGMMACNPKWCQPLSVWKQYFSDWVAKPEIENLVEISTFLDFRAVQENEELSYALRNHVFTIAQANSTFLLKLADMIANYKSPVNVFGNLIGNDLNTKEKTIDLKEILTPVVKYARVLALKHGIEGTGTLERVKAIYNKDKVPKQFYNDFYLTFNNLMKIRLLNQSRTIQAGAIPTNTVDLADLSAIEKGLLKSISTFINQISANVSSGIKTD